MGAAAATVRSETIGVTISAEEMKIANKAMDKHFDVTLLRCFLAPISL
jgi:hypothetical protein